MRLKIFWTFQFLLCLGLTINGVVALDQEEMIKAQKYDHPIREVSVIASDEGFYPERITGYVGEKMRFFIISSTQQPSCFFLQDKKIFLSAEKGQVHSAEAYFDKEGIYEFYCPTGKIKGRLSVIERPDDKKKREIASEQARSKVRVWRPRDE